MYYTGVIVAALLFGWSGFFLSAQGILRDEILWAWLLATVALLFAALKIARSWRHTEGKSERGFGTAMRQFGTLLVVAAISTFGSVSGLIHWANQGESFFFWASAIQLWASGAAAAYGLVRFARWQANSPKAI